MAHKSHRSKVEKYPLPDSVDGILSLLREIMSVGAVQRIEISMNEPVRVTREIEVDNADLQEPDVDLDGVLRSIEFTEYASPGASPYQVVVDMTQLMSKQGLNSICWVTGTGELDILSEWLDYGSRGMPAGSDTLLDRPVHRLKSIPEDTLILCGSKYPSADPSEYMLAVKTAIEFRSDEDGPRDVTSSQAHDRSWDHSQEHRPANGPVALTTGGLRRVEWNRSGRSRE